MTEALPLDEAKARSAHEAALASARFPVSDPQIEVHASIGSTNDRAKELAAAGAPEGSMVVSLAQESGRGRRGRAWSSPSGGLYFSLLLRPDDAMLRRLPVTLLGGLAAVQTLEEHDVPATLKWPNDVHVNGRKVAGILGEMDRDEVGHRLVLGVGINVATDLSALPPEVAELATSVAAVRGGEAPPPEVLLESFLAHFFGHYGAIRRGGGATILAMASARMPLLGQPITVRLSPEKRVSGIASGLSATGGLVLEHEDGQRREVLLAGEVEEVRAK